ncbi:3-deoxy-D-manno-octulosonic acid transferase [Uliginosibacterium sp. H1]|uniref:3-deoxy-D-manno-octulosonic acid transferase n=1 Tax=Uliginosibacterium sp. H1 TaxID=3114757 RepID=UPI002E16E33A|nr:glycosyltransferase N-terminal domain-containing protein [Uliginosibacterium sp. H1]
MHTERSIPLLTRLRYSVFRQLEKRATPTVGTALPAGKSAPALWVFVSTIGELNAIGPFLRQLVARHADLRLVLLTDRSIYRESYLAQYPQAEVVEIGASGEPAHTLAQQRPPTLFVVAEIPCLPADAPCRLPIGYLYAARAAGARVALVNGWLYGYAPACRMDSIERSLLGRDYLALFDLLCVQTEAVAHHLQNSGAAASQLHVTGNIKFDALAPAVRPPGETRSPRTLGSLDDGGRPVIVAGCLTDAEELATVLDAFQRLVGDAPRSLLVLAPRHPENGAAMSAMFAELQGRGLGFRNHAVEGDLPVPDDLPVLVLNTMGELRDYYARSTVSHVGKDHNILEPLSFSRPVTITAGWNTTYPSYPVYTVATREGLVYQAESAEALAARWASCINSETGSGTRVQASLARLAGATQRTLDLFSRQHGLSS